MWFGARAAFVPSVNLQGSFIVNSIYPGLAYHPPSGRIVAWQGGDTVYSLKLGTGVWTPTTFAGGPTALRVN